MKRLLTLLFILITFHLSAQWRQISDDTMFYNERIYFNSASKGFVPALDGVLQKTFDGGLTWDTLYIDTCDWSSCLRSPYPSDLRSIVFLDHLTGYMGGQDGDFFKTEDGGLTWHCAGMIGGWDDVMEFYFFNADTGMATGGGIWRTVDGGQSWNYLPSPTIGYRFAPINDSVLLMTSNNGIFRSEDYGASWTRMNADTNYRYYDISMGDSFHGIAALQYPNSKKIVTTSDGGLNWSAPQTVSNSFIYCVKMINADSGFIGGGRLASTFPSLPGYGIMMVTTDGGLTWSQPQTIANDPIRDIEFPNDSVGFAIGWRGNIFRNDDPFNLVGISENENQSFHPIIFPNPVSGDELNIIMPGFLTDQTISVSITDLTGREIIPETVRRISPYTIDVSILVPGSYLILVRIEGEVFASPFVKQ